MKSSIRNQYLSAMGIDVWVSREASVEFETDSIDNAIATLNWDELENVVKTCQQCELHKSRKNSVFGSGNKQADIFIIGSIPNHQEDSSAREFIDSEGILLDNMLLFLNLSRKDVYTTNLVKCTSKHHRHFSNTEMASCVNYLERQIELVNPKVLILFGEQVAQFILKQNNAMDVLTTEKHVYLNKDILVVVIEHPEQLLLSSASKKQALLNLLQIKPYLAI